MQRLRNSDPELTEITFTDKDLASVPFDGNVYLGCKQPGVKPDMNMVSAKAEYYKEVIQRKCNTARPDQKQKDKSVASVVRAAGGCFIL